MITGDVRGAQIYALPINILFASPCTKVMCHHSTVVIVACGKFVGISLNSVPLTCSRVKGSNVGSAAADLQAEWIASGGDTHFRISCKFTMKLMPLITTLDGQISSD